jgi:hypothetical protein
MKSINSQNENFRLFHISIEDLLKNLGSLTFKFFIWKLLLAECIELRAYLDDR